MKILFFAQKMSKIMFGPREIYLLSSLLLIFDVKLPNDKLETLFCAARRRAVLIGIAIDEHIYHVTNFKSKLNS